MSGGHGCAEAFPRPSTRGVNDECSFRALTGAGAGAGQRTRAETATYVKPVRLGAIHAGEADHDDTL
jgi:hypothetical protein